MKKGFTLIELLAVIVILAIIALIATPIVLNIINDTKESATLRSADFYLDAVEYAIANKVLNNETLNDGAYSVMSNGNICLGTLETNTCTGDILEVEVNGETPISGTIVIKNGEISYVEGLEIGSTKVSTGVGELTLNDNRVICKSVTKETRLQDKHYAFESINENKETVFSTELTYIGNIPEGNYNPGDEYLCEVKPGTVYRFYVLSTNNSTGERITDSSTDKAVNTVNLIMDQNITDSGVPVTETNPGYVAWIAKDDYLLNGGSEAEWDIVSDEKGNNNKGPITAMNYLIRATASWINIPEIPIGENGINIVRPVKSYNNFIIYRNEDPYIQTEEVDWPYTFNFTTKARMILIEEAMELGCMFEDSNRNYFDTCPLWLSNNLRFKRDVSKGESVPTGATVITNGPRGYWALNGNGNGTTEGSTNDGGRALAYEILDHANLNAKDVYTDNYNGVRAVITLPKENLN